MSQRITTPDGNELMFQGNHLAGRAAAAGGYYSQRRPGVVNAQALSAGLARRLWDQTEEILRTAATPGSPGSR